MHYYFTEVSIYWLIRCCGFTICDDFMLLTMQARGGKTSPLFYNDVVLLP